jgi:hypothetical protein
MNLYKDTDQESSQTIDAYLQADGSLRIDLVDSGKLAESWFGDWDHERILTIADPHKLVLLLLREGFAKRALTFERVGQLAHEAGCNTSYWAG